jgi:hypothetical protein
MAMVNNNVVMNLSFTARGQGQDVCGRLCYRLFQMSLIGCLMSRPAPRSKAAMSASAKREISYSTLTVRPASSKEIFRTPGRAAGVAAVDLHVNEREISSFLLPYSLSLFCRSGLGFSIKESP